MTTLEICLLQWDTYNKRMQKVIDSISDENFNHAIIATGNSPSWLLGHLADTDDKLLELFGISERMFPELSTIYHHERVTNQHGHLSKAELNKKWNLIVAKLDTVFKNMTEADWLARHMSVTEEEFKKEPHRNKLNVLLSRVTHKASHLGQIAMQSK
ncbi:MAG: DinB family protein [Cyclobacteriaceae bacterium]|nr:DinB family protein [Cyclobacteriaceae bacterium]